jgi:hypothetical protein
MQTGRRPHIHGQEAKPKGHPYVDDAKNAQDGIADEASGGRSAQAGAAQQDVRTDNVAAAAGRAVAA